MATVQQFDDLDEFSMTLFEHWLAAEKPLAGPHDFHSLAHYLSLYVLATKFQIESLENTGTSLLSSYAMSTALLTSLVVMDLVRHYYREQNLTAPGYRLEYIYTYTHSSNYMRTFLVSTAAFRALEEQSKLELASALPQMHQASHLSASIREVLAKNPAMAVDFVEELITLHRNGDHDARFGPNCA